MATWGEVLTMPAGATNAVTDGTKIYYTHTTGRLHVNQWDEASETQILTGSSYAGRTASLLVFGGSLYDARREGATQVLVQKWDGSSWSTVLTIDGSTAVTMDDFWGDETGMILFVTDDGTKTTYYSTNGDDWDDDALTYENGDLNNANAYFDCLSKPQDRPKVWGHVAGAAINGDLCELTAGEFAQKETGWGTWLSATFTLSAVNQDYLWRSNAGTYEYHDGTFPGAWTAPAVNYKPIQGVNIDRSFAWNFDGDNTDLYIWSGGAWVLDGSNVATADLSNTADPRIIRLNNNHVYAYTPSADGAILSQRDANISGENYPRGEGGVTPPGFILTHSGLGLPGSIIEAAS